MLPPAWSDHVFPQVLREDRIWLSAFSKNRRTHVLGFAAAAERVGRRHIDSIRAGLNPAFGEDPRRYIPLAGWREMFPLTGEPPNPTLGFYETPPRAPRYPKCTKWGPFGKDQPEHAWLKRPMRLYDALKCLAALYDAEEQTGAGPVTASPDGVRHDPGEVSLHVAIFFLSRFSLDYFERHFANDPERLADLYDHCGLKSHHHGDATNTFLEMASGMPATARTCAGIASFCQARGLPNAGSLEMDLSTRGTNRSKREKVKKRREGTILYYSEDCAVEVFWR